KDVELWVVLQDMKKAFDLVSLTVGLTELVKMVDGIEQEEVLFLLLWHIFYDPLLVRIQEAKELRYYVSMSEPKLKSRDYIQKKEIKMAIVAYTDDTIWVAPNKQVIKKMLSIANEFFYINNIQINVKKSNLIVFNPKTKVEERSITFGSDSILDEKLYNIMRLLGVWLNSRLNERQLFLKAKRI
ncbi:10345_t:CDS:2, partial [Gigaspora margarita]